MFSVHVLRTSMRHAGLGAMVTLGLCGAAFADKGEFDPTVPEGTPALTAPAPVPDYSPTVDPTLGKQPGLGGIAGGVNNLPQQVSIDIDINGAGLDFVAAILDRDPDDNLYIKVQSSGGGKFNQVGFYHGAGTTGWAGMTGGAAFFSLAAADQFTSARMRVTHDGNGSVTLFLTDVVGGTNNQSYNRAGWVPRNASSSGFGGFAGDMKIDNWGVAFTGDVISDNFTRANGGLGSNWVTTDGTASILGNSARASSTSHSYFIGGTGIIQSVEADITQLGSALDYVALVLNYDGLNNIFIKIQEQDAGFDFDHIGFYQGVNGSGWTGQTGGPAIFAIPDAYQFDSAHMRVTMDSGGRVRLLLTEIDGGNGFLEYQRGGWQETNGDGWGYGGFDGNFLCDNIAINRFGICDTFNRDNGTLGSNWTTTDGTSSITNFTGRGSGNSRAIFTGICGSGCSADIAPFGGNGVVDIDDLLFIINHWGACP